MSLCSRCDLYRVRADGVVACPECESGLLPPSRRGTPEEEHARSLTCERAELQSAIDRIGRDMQALTDVPDAEWERRRDALLAELDAVDAKLRDRGEMISDYGWTIDGSCNWQKVNEEPAPQPAADWSPFGPEELIVITESFGARLRVEGGRLRAENAADVPASLRMAIRERQAEVAEAVMVGGACS